MRSSFSHINDLWGALVVEELVRTGVTCFVISPGSRSTPLVYAVSQNKRATPDKQASPVLHFDERGAAFYALGHAKATGIPAVLICTSGTAAANYFPAVIEASADQVPLIILTADRPPELRGASANQTIDQVKLYGDYVRYQMDIPCPAENIPPEYILTTIDQAVYRSLRSPAGPVHLNFMFREPLAPTGRKESFNNYLESIGGWLKSSSPYTEYALAYSELPEETLKKITVIINKSKSGIIIAGKSNDSAQVLSLSQKIGWPLFPDIASDLRLGVKNPNVIPFYDQLLFSEKLQKLQPETVLHFGSQPVSKRLLEFLEFARPKNYIRIAEHPKRHDPNHQVTLRIDSNISEFCKQIMDRPLKKSIGKQAEQFKHLSKVVADTLREIIDTPPDDLITEPAVSRIISKHISKDSALFLGSSLPVREMDMYAVSNGASVPVEYNRGASGIDGTIATAIGYANGLRRAVTLLIGDLAFLHDLNSLALVQRSKFPLTIVIINNDGGGIFSFLPVVEIGKAFEPYFGTPHGLSFEKSAEQFDIASHHPKSITAFTKTYAASQKKKSSTIIEVSTGRKANLELNKQISRTVKTALSKA
jgi:2-succinyl-5-enolpyruvyl-6-hydroxy-3-cyclohexene-1-carboxylate synthase